MIKSKTDKNLTLILQKNYLQKCPTPLKGVGNGKIDVFKELTPHSRTF